MTEATTTPTAKLLVFGASWCGPCRVSKPHLDKFDEAYDMPTEYLDVDAEANAHIVARYKVQSIPTVVALDEEGNEVNRRVGSYNLGHLLDLSGAPA